MKVESIDVGKRILTLQELSDKSGMSATAISAIERNVSSPTVSTLVNIARALGESLSSLLGEEEKEYIFTKLENRETIATEIKDVEFKSLGSGLPNQKFHPMISSLKPGATSGADYVNHGGEDFFFVLKGALEIDMDGKIFRLEDGDSIYFRLYSFNFAPTSALPRQSNFHPSEGELPFFNSSLIFALRIFPWLFLGRSSKFSIETGTLKEAMLPPANRSISSLVTETPSLRTTIATGTSPYS
jgi:transcriptional regulator with XRE-family HTH domain